MNCRPLLAFVAGLCVSAAAWQASATCELDKRAELPVTMAGSRATVSVKINGHPATMMIDSGAFFSGVSEDAAVRFGMKPTPAPAGMQVRGVGGREERARAARAAEFDFAGNQLKDWDFLVGGRLANAGIDGMLGQNLLGTLEVEYDLSNGVIRLFKARNCAGDTNLAYWSAGLTLSRAPLAGGGDYLTQLIAPGRLNGRPIRVDFDSGAPVSVLSRTAAARVGVGAATPGVVQGEATYGAFGAGVESLVAPFESFEVGEEEARNIRLRVADLALLDGDMLLGMEFFLAHRILVSRSQHRIYFTANGGPPADRPARAPIAVLAQAPLAPAALSADDLSRRAAAAISQRDYSAAIADLGRAIVLEPTVGRYYLQRATAKIGAGQRSAALADLNEALKVAPDDAHALMLRGEIFILNRDLARAQADFDAAIRLAPNDVSLPLRAAEAYLRTANFEAATRLYDRWLAAFPRDPNIGQVAGFRCNARAGWGQELEAGLADCDFALRQDGKLSPVMQNRGVILLRMGRLDEAIAQFDAAIGVQPRSALALFGRGLAKLRKGSKAEGDADIAAASDISPSVVQEARRFGLTVEGPAPPPAGRS
jgi:tetratricopeptide (TPR) repeat protein/predicted aspartyl protease